MSAINGINSWQIGDINGQAHAIEKCGSHTGHTVRAVAFCDSAETATLLVDALALLTKMYQLNPERAPSIKAILQRAGIVQ